MPIQERLIKKDIEVSKCYTAFAWIDKMLLISTKLGDVLIADMSGEFKMILASSPGPSFKI
jgi:hypothetical protein